MTMPALPAPTIAQADVPANAPSQDIPQIAGQILRLSEGELKRLRVINDYVRGSQAGVYVPQGARDEYKWLRKRSVVNILPLVVSVVTENLHVDGYRPSVTLDATDDYTAQKALQDAQDAIDAGDIAGAHDIITKAAASPLADATGSAEDNLPWQIWQANRMGSRQHGLHRAISKYGVGYTMIMPGSLSGKPMPVMRAISPRRLTALYEDDIDSEWPMYAVEQYFVNSPHGKRRIVQLYDDQHRYTLTGDAKGYDLTWMDDYDPLMPTGSTSVDEHGLGVCPVIRFTHEIDLDGESDVTGDVEPLMALQDQVNTITFNLLMAMQYSAFRQRWVTGMVPDDADGRPKEPFRSGVDRLFVAENVATKFGEFGQTELADFINSREASLRHMATVSQVPPYHILGLVANLSAEALAASRDGLDRKVEELQGTLDEPYKQTMQLAAHAAGDTQHANDSSASVAWRDTGARAFAATVDALGKMSQMLGVPATELWAKIPGTTLDDVERWKAAVAKPGVLENLAAMLAAAESKNAMTAAPQGVVTPEEPFSTDVAKPTGF